MAMRWIPLCRIMRAPTGTKRGTGSHYCIGPQRAAKRGITEFLPSRRGRDARAPNFESALGQEALGVERGHAARTCGCDRLTIDRIGDVAGREDARDARRGREPF